MLIASAIVSGLGLGSMYGLLALGFHVTHAVSRTVNFAQGSTMMLGAVLCFTFWVTLGWPLALAVVLALVACALWGVAVERVAVRPFIARGSNSWLIATVALGIAQAGSTDADAIRMALEDLKTPYEGLIKTFVRPFTAENHDALGPDDYIMVHYEGDKIVPAN